MKSKCLPSKTIQQMYLQTQRIVGQQSLAAFMGLRLDVEQIGRDNKNKEVSTNDPNLFSGPAQDGFPCERWGQADERAEADKSIRGSRLVWPVGGVLEESQTASSD